MADRLLYVGTWEGLYEARPAGDAYQTRLLGLQSPPGPKELWNHHRGVHPAGKGAVRCPVVVDRDDTRRLYAGTNRAGVFVSEDAGETWREANQGLVYKEVWSLAQHPLTGDLFVGTGPSALFRSTDRAESWIECQQLRFLPTTKNWTFPGPPHVSRIRHIGWHGDDADVVYGSVEEGGVIRSRDRGTTWGQIDERHGIYTDVHTVNPMPDDPRTLVATTGKGAYRSFDAGDSWLFSSDGLGDRRYLAQIAVHPSRPHVLYTAASASDPSNWPKGADSAFFRSDDRGASWRRLGGGVPAYLAAGVRTVAGDPADPDAVFVGMTDGAIWMTEDGGESFRLVVRDLPQVTSIQVAHR
jgi:photosystem II stability/assembly factor-like uncharacterized protein